MDSETLRTGAAALGIELDDGQLRQFERYAELLAEWNTRVNLTRIPPEQVVPLQFLDSLAAFRAVDVSRCRRLLDVGTGAGMPGVPLKIASPALDLTLLDATRKRLTFLDRVIAELDLDRARTLHARAEDAAHLPVHRERYDLVTARAVARLDAVCELLLPFVEVGGAAIALKSAGAHAEIDAAHGAVARVGGTVERVASVRLPGTDVERLLVVLRKTARTPARYPRPPAEIRARPAA